MGKQSYPCLKIRQREMQQSQDLYKENLGCELVAGLATSDSKVSFPPKRYRYGKENVISSYADLPVTSSCGILLPVTRQERVFIAHSAWNFQRGVKCPAPTHCKSVEIRHPPLLRSRSPQFGKLSL